MLMVHFTMSGSMWSSLVRYCPERIMTTYNMGFNMTVKKIHHINFIVKDLDSAVLRYKAILGGNEFIRDELSGRGVITARTAVGEQWIVLVQPIELNSIPGRYLAENGEGFFLMSLEVTDINETIDELSKEGILPTSSIDRKGLLNWWVRDLKIDKTFGTQIQFCEERD
jgi:methylmalonyl-CoA/ethylmalonyl-CoA epimerase